MESFKILLFAIMAICFSVAAHAQNTKTKSKTKTLQSSNLVYACPMKCKGDKTYTKAGDCPVCGMHLEAEQKSTAYQCPMRCEGDKTYGKEGTCPVCNMQLKPVTNKGKQQSETNHFHNHSSR